MTTKQVAIWAFYIIAIILFCGLGIFMAANGSLISGAVIFFIALLVFGRPIYKELKGSGKI